MKIGQVARATGYPTTTIRYYEERGLIPAHMVRRGANGYRTYDPAVIQRLHNVRHAQQAGFTLEEVSALVDAWEDGRLDDAQQHAVLCAKIADLTTRIEALVAMRAALETKVAQLSPQAG